MAYSYMVSQALSPHKVKCKAIRHVFLPPRNKLEVVDTLSHGKTKRRYNCFSGPGCCIPSTSECAPRQCCTSHLSSSKTLEKYTTDNIRHEICESDCTFSVPCNFFFSFLWIPKWGRGSACIEVDLFLAKYNIKHADFKKCTG